MSGQTEPTCWLGPIPEERMLKAGLNSLRQAIGEEGLLSFPRRANGTPMLMRQGFFERLLRQQVSLQNCLADASAAEADLGKLSLCQLLAIRCRHFEFVSGSQTSEVSFLLHLDRRIMALLAERLLGEDTSELKGTDITAGMRQVVLIYGAAQELQDNGTPFSVSWWRLVVGDNQRFLNLPSCKLFSNEPSVSVCCYRSQSSAGLYDPRRKRIFRWHVTLAQDIETWVKEVELAEKPPPEPQSSQDDTVAADADESSIPASAHSVEDAKCFDQRRSLFFSDFNIEELLVGIGRDDESSPCRRMSAESCTIDDFFDSLQSEALFDHADRKNGKHLQEDEEEHPSVVDRNAVGADEEVVYVEEQMEMTEMLQKLRNLQACLDATEQARSEALVAASEAIEKEAKANYKVHELEMMLEALKSSQDVLSEKRKLSGGRRSMTSTITEDIQLQKDALSHDDANEQQHVENRQDIDALRSQLQTSREQCRSLMRKLRESQHGGDTQRKVLCLDDENLLERIDVLEAENARLEDQVRESAALYVPKIQELTAEVNEAQEELEQALESQRALQQDVVGKAQVIQELLKRCQPSSSHMKSLRGLTFALPRLRSGQGTASTDTG